MTASYVPDDQVASFTGSSRLTDSSEVAGGSDKQLTRRLAGDTQKQAVLTSSKLIDNRVGDKRHALKHPGSKQSGNRQPDSRQPSDKHPGDKQDSRSAYRQLHCRCMRLAVSTLAVMATMAVLYVVP